VRAATLALALLAAAPSLAQTTKPRSARPARPTGPRVAPRPESVKALLDRARVQSSRGDPKGALELLGRARTLAPNSEDVLSAYAQMALASHAPVPAILALEPLTRMAPSVGQYHYLLGVALMQAGDMEAAAEALERAEGVEPNRALTLVALGLALNSRKLYAEARPYLVRSLELEPAGAEALAALAESEDGLGELAAAEDHAQRALARDGANATGNLVLGLLRMKQQRYEDARDFLVRAVAADPSARTHYQLSLAYARLGDEASARKHVELYQRALRDVEERLRVLHGKGGPGDGIRP